MASDDGGLEFVNRENELAFLDRCFAKGAQSPALVVLKAPSGFGKSRLIDRFRTICAPDNRVFCVIDPSVRARPGSALLHEGYYLQRCAEALSDMAPTGEQSWPSFEQYLRQRGWRTAAEKALLEVAGELPSLSSLYKQGFDYLTRMLGLGRYSARSLLGSDQGHAVSLCSEYALRTLQSHPVILVIREAQHLDILSLRSLLGAQSGHSAPDLIFEYTTESGEFESEHHKALLDAAARRGAISILNVSKLGLPHLEQLLRDYVVDAPYELNTEAYLIWNGNLRSVVELTFRVGIGQIAASPSEITGVLEDLQGGLNRHFDELTTLQRLLLVVIQVHFEPLDEMVLSRVAAASDPALQPTTLQRALEELIDIHHFVVRSQSNLALQHESIATAIAERADFQHLVALAESGLRDFYRRSIQAADYRQVGMPMAIRQLFRLCARTGDIAGLASVTHTFMAEIKAAKDQAVYIDAIATAIETEPDLFAGDHDELVGWAAALAYDASDWPRVLRLQDLRQSQDSGATAMRAFALQEMGKHAEALELADTIRERASNSDDRLVADLISAISIGCRGDHEGARAILDRLTGDPALQATPLLGYAFRLYDMIDSYTDILPKMMASVDWFGRFGLAKSKAYSQLPAAIYLARLGDIRGARRRLTSAQRVLANEVRDQDILLNNRAAVELLADAPDHRMCVDLLQAALQQASDDYSELTILTNLALANWQSGNLPAALGCVARAQRILEHHDFEDKDTYWPVCFNLAQILGAAGELDQAREMLNFPRQWGRPLVVNKSYWLFRYGERADVEPAYRFLASKPIHPLYLSRWLVDLEGLQVLTPAPVQ